MKFAGIFSSASSTRGRVSPMASFIVRMRTKSIADAKMIAFGSNVGIDDLIVEKLRVLRFAGNAPVVVIEQAAEEAELALLVEHLDPHEVASWRTNACTRCSSRARSRSICVRSSVFMPLIDELRLQLVHGSGRIAEERAEARR